MKIQRIPYKAALILGLFEAIALFFVVLFELDMTVKGSLLSKFIGGFATGFFTALIAVFLINFFVKKIKIGLFAPAVFNGLFLAFLFTIESSFVFVKSIGIILGNAIASLSTPLSLILVLIIYNLFNFKSYFITKKKNIISKIRIFPVVLVAAIYEILFLPLFAFFSQNISNKLLFYPLIALIIGVFSAVIAIYFYNILPKKLKEILKIK